MQINTNFNYSLARRSYSWLARLVANTSFKQVSKDLAYLRAKRNKPVSRFVAKAFYLQRKQEKYFIGETAEKALEEAKKVFPDKLFYVTRIGGPARISIRFPHGYGWIFR